MKSFKEFMTERNRGLWDNIHAKRERIKHGSGEHMRKPGSKGAPTAAALKASQTNEEVSPMIKPPNRRFDNKSDAFAHVKKHGGKVYKGTYIDPNNGTKHISFHVKEEVINERGEDSKGYKRSTESGAGLTRKGAKHFGVKTAVTGKVKPGSKAAKRRKSFCARMSGVKGPMKDEKGRPTRKAMSLRRWRCRT